MIRTVADLIVALETLPSDLPIDPVEGLVIDNGGTRNAILKISTYIIGQTDPSLYLRALPDGRPGTVVHQFPDGTVAVRDDDETEKRWWMTREEYLSQPTRSSEPNAIKRQMMDILLENTRRSILDAERKGGGDHD